MVCLSGTGTVTVILKKVGLLKPLFPLVLTVLAQYKYRKYQKFEKYVNFFLKTTRLLHECGLTFLCFQCICVVISEVRGLISKVVKGKISADVLHFSIQTMILPKLMISTGHLQRRFISSEDHYRGVIPALRPRAVTLLTFDAFSQVYKLFQHYKSQELVTVLEKCTIKYTGNQAKILIYLPCFSPFQCFGSQPLFFSCNYKRVDFLQRNLVH